MPDDPENPVLAIDDERDRVAFFPSNFEINEQILQFLPAPLHAGRPQPVAPAPGSHAEGQSDVLGPERYLEATDSVRHPGRARVRR